ncbi:MAG: toll/interleukin-1 receptor domain-containing protein [Planctomycetes bacterium]|nr:toll/interleukin-1 receptor domain-containing protein [Planctomycetota bacterium]
MANPEHVEIVKQGADAIAKWQGQNPGTMLDLREADLQRASLCGAGLRGAWLGGTNLRSADLRIANLTDANLIGADLSSANLNRANLEGADLFGANLSSSNLSYAKLSSAKVSHANLCGSDLSRASLFDAILIQAKLIGADLSYANLIQADLSRADLRDADLSHAELGHTNLSYANLGNAKLSGSFLQLTLFVDVDLSAAKGLSDVVHEGPSHIDHATLSHRGWQLPEKFLRGCGLRPWEVTHARMYDPAITPPQFIELQYKALDERMTGPLYLGGVFISYSHDDSKFADKMYTRLEDDGANVWLDRHDALAGDLQKQIDRAMRLNDVVLLILSESSVESDWVEHELKQARQKEKQEGRDVLCPVALDDTWKEKTDSDVLWGQLTKKNILDFSKWKTKAFEQPFAKLVKGLKVNYPRPAPAGDA